MNFSVAYFKLKTLQEGHGTIRWIRQWLDESLNGKKAREREIKIKRTRVQSLVIHIVGHVSTLQLRWRDGWLLLLLLEHLTSTTDLLDERSTQDTVRYWTPTPHDCEHYTPQQYTDISSRWRSMAHSNKQSYSTYILRHFVHWVDALLPSFITQLFYYTRMFYYIYT